MRAAEKVEKERAASDVPPGREVGRMDAALKLVRAALALECVAPMLTALLLALSLELAS